MDLYNSTKWQYSIFQRPSNIHVWGWRKTIRVFILCWNWLGRCAGRYLSIQPFTMMTLHHHVQLVSLFLRSSSFTSSSATSMASIVFPWSLFWNSCPGQACTLPPGYFLMLYKLSSWKCAFKNLANCLNSILSSVAIYSSCELCYKIELKSIHCYPSPWRPWSNLLPSHLDNSTIF